jgi:uncharacterized protein
LTVSAAPTAPNPERHVPERSCVACRRKRPQGELLRLTRTAAGWQLTAGARQGRGSYLCGDTSGCWSEKRLKRSFGAQSGALSALLLARLPAAVSPSPATPHRTMD